MELQITNKLGTYEIAGSLTSENSTLVRDHFNHLLDHYEEVIMSLKKVKKIDKKGIAVLKDIYAKAIKRNKILFVLGKENKNITPVFNQNKVTHIFRNDY